MSTAPVTLSTEQLLAAFAQGLLPLAGPIGIAVSSLIPAAEQFLANLKANPDAIYTVDDLEAVVAKGNADLATLAAHVNALPGG